MKGRGTMSQMLQYFIIEFKQDKDELWLQRRWIQSTLQHDGQYIDNLKSMTLYTVIGWSPQMVVESQLQGNEPSHEYPTGVQTQESGSSQQIPMSPMANNADQMISHIGMADMANIHTEGHADAATTSIVWLWTRTTATTTLCISTQLSQCTRRGFFDFSFQYG